MSYNPQNPNGSAISTNSAPVVIASDQSAVPITVGSLPLPTAAATSAKQPALGTAGTPSADILSVQGATSMTPLKVDGSAVTQPISGSVTTTPSGTQTVTGTVASTQSGIWTVQPGNTANTTAWLTADTGTKATNTAVPASASYSGLLAQTANPAAATAGNLVGALADKLGKQVVVGSIRDLKANQITTITASTAETTIVTAVASSFLDLYGLIVTNTSPTAINVVIKDATAGTTRLTIAVPGNDTRGLMLPESGAIKQSAVTNNWTATVSNAVTSVIITALTVANT
ncbi:MAG: hypothetical protein ABIQ04_00140 [Candidatus Saccharimonadales bacterium]